MNSEQQFGGTAPSGEHVRDVALEALEDLRADEPVVLDVRGKTGITDYMIVAAGTSNRHIKALADHVQEKARENGMRPLGVEGVETAEWVLVDLGDVVVHVMSSETRDLYRLERIWGIDEAGDSARELSGSH